MIKEELDPDLPLPAGNPLDLVLPGLYIGDFGASKDVDLLKRLNIKHILTVALESLPDTVLKALPDLNCLHIQTSDLPTTDIMTSFEKSNKFIDDGLKTGNAVLVHCTHGVSRSGALVLAYIMTKNNLSLNDAYAFLHQKRPCVYPNEGFRKQLHLWEKMSMRLDETFKAYKMYRLSHVSGQIVLTEKLPVANTSHGVLYRCKKCRHVLLTEDNVFPHHKGEIIHWYSMTVEADRQQLCTQGLFVEPMDWMDCTRLYGTHRLQCICGYKLGSCSWKDMIRCPCGGSSAPGFYVNMSRVDRSVVRQHTA